VSSFGRNDGSLGVREKTATMLWLVAWLSIYRKNAMEGTPVRFLAEGRQRQKQIPFGDDNQNSKGNGKDKSKSEGKATK
jgi:hypothetical protein